MGVKIFRLKSAPKLDGICMLNMFSEITKKFNEVDSLRKIKLTVFVFHFFDGFIK